MDLSDKNYKFMAQQNAISKLMDLNDTLLQVDGPLVHFTLKKCIERVMHHGTIFFTMNLLHQPYVVKSI